jgi:hypothetical protein
MSRLRLALMICVITMQTSCGSRGINPTSSLTTPKPSPGETARPTRTSAPTSTTTAENTEPATPTEDQAETPSPTVTRTRTPVPTREPTNTVSPATTPTLIEAPPTGDVPILMEVDNYLEHADALAGYGPFHLYGWVVDARIDDFDYKVEQLGNISSREVEKKLLVFSSYHNLSRKLDHGEETQYRPDDLKALGITSVSYNSERGLSPPDEMEHLLSTDPDDNSVATFVRIAKRHGFEASWGPIAFTAYTAPEPALSVMFSAGLDQIGLQEQKMIDESCVRERVTAIRKAKATYERVAGRPVEVGTQVMPGYQYSEGCYPGDAYHRVYLRALQPIRCNPGIGRARGIDRDLGQRAQ